MSKSEQTPKLGKLYIDNVDGEIIVVTRIDKKGEWMSIRSLDPRYYFEKGGYMFDYFSTRFTSLEVFLKNEHE